MTARAGGVQVGSVRVAVLGAAEIVVDGVRQELGAAKHRALLGILAMHAGRRVGVDTIVDALWGELPPAGATSTLQGYVADLRRLLEPDRAPREQPRLLVTVSSGYALRLAPEDLDLTRFESRVRRAIRELDVLGPSFRPAVPDDRREDVEHLLDDLDRAIADWRGEPLVDLGSQIEVVAERDRLRSLLLDAQTSRATAALGLGKHAEAAGDLERLARANPWNERVWGLYAVALAGSGRQADALSCLRELKDSLRDELGIDPTGELQRLETAIVRQEVVAAVPAAKAPATGTPISTPEEPWPFVGRSKELGHIDRLVGLTLAGRPQVLHVTGEHGIGKSRMVRELERVALGRGFQVMRALCRESMQHVPLWAWTRLTADRAPLPDGSTSVAADALTRVAEDAHERLISSGAPLLLVIDDAQWADEATLQTLDHLVRDLAAGRVFVVLAHRLQTQPLTPGMSGLLATLARRHADRMPLVGLEPEAVGRLLTAVAGVHAHPHMTELASSRMDGNPFLLIELAREGDFNPGALPPSIQAAVSHHLGRIAAPTLELLAPASLLTRTWDADLLAIAADIEVDEVFAAMTSAVTAGVLVEETHDRYTFTHEVAREVLATRLSGPARARWHARFAAVVEELLDRPDRRGEMARHWRAAGYPFARRAWQADLEAARHALADDLPEEAAALLELAAEAQRLDRHATHDERRLLTDLRADIRAAEHRGAGAPSDPMRTA